MATSHSNRKTFLAILTVGGLLLWGCSGVLRALLFPENVYFTAGTVEELPERFRGWVPPEATAIRLRTYQSAYWITAESRCKEPNAIRWASSINCPLGSQWGISKLPDHSLPADQLGFISVPNDKERYSWSSGGRGARISLVYDRKTTTLYLLKNSG